MRQMVLAVVMVAVGVNGALAQGPTGRRVLRFHTGITTPIFGDWLSGYWKPGLSLGAAVGYTVHPRVRLEGHVAYTRLGFDERSFLASQAVPQSNSDLASVTILTATANVVWSIARWSTITPYLTGGIGPMRNSQGGVWVLGWVDYYYPPRSATSVSRWFLLTELGAGLELMGGNRTRLFVETRYSLAMGTFLGFEKQEFLPIQAGVTINW
jgi:hypothetical protein